jgi:hypothetical protein
VSELHIGSSLAVLAYVLRDRNEGRIQTAFRFHPPTLIVSIQPEDWKQVNRKKWVRKVAIAK